MESEINTQTWWYNPSSHLYFLSTKNDPREEFRGTLAVGNFNRSMFCSDSLEQGIERGVYLSFNNDREGWTLHEGIFYDSSSQAYQIDARRWRSTKRGIRFEDLDNSVAPHILYHQERIYTLDGGKTSYRALEISTEELDTLFEMLWKKQERVTR